jgi:hypothetical protein
MPSTTERRAPDPRINILVEEMKVVRVELAANTHITKQVADVLASFRVIGAIAKWSAAIAAACTAIWHGLDGMMHK